MTLKEHRKQLGLTQSQVAEKLDVNQAAVSWWESGRWKPLRKYQKKLAALYGVTADELLKAMEEAERCRG